MIFSAAIVVVLFFLLLLSGSTLKYIYIFSMRTNAIGIILLEFFSSLVGALLLREERFI